MKKKIEKALQSVFAYGMGIMMIVVLFVAIGYIIAFIVGCPNSETICGFMGKYILPVVYVTTIVLCIVGVIDMYLRGEHVFLLGTLPTRDKNHD